jgi:hypothetical protein
VTALSTLGCEKNDLGGLYPSSRSRFRHPESFSKVAPEGAEAELAVGFSSPELSKIKDELCGDETLFAG